MLSNRGMIAFVASVLMFAAGVRAGAPATQADAPLSATSIATIQLRANESMAKNDYATALPLLQKVEQQLADQPDQLGPVLEQIRVCRRQIQLAASGSAQPKLSVLPPGQQRVPHPEPTKGQTLDLAIKDLGNFDYDVEKGGNLPQDVQKLDGATLRTHGFMIALDQADNITEFALVPSLTTCCFGQPPQIQHTIIVHCPKGKSVPYCPDDLVVEGKLHVREQKDGGFIISIFDMDASSVKPSGD